MITGILLFITAGLGALLVWAEEKFPEVDLQDQCQDLEEDIEQCGQHLRERLAAIRERSAT